MDARNDFPDRPWTIEEVARYLQVSERTVYSRMKEGLPARKVGGSLRFLRDEVDAWIRSQDAAESVA